MQTLRQSQLDHAHIPSITVEELERPSARPPDWPGKAAQHAHSQSAPGPLPADPLQSPPTPPAVPLGPPAAKTPQHPLQEPPRLGMQAVLNPRNMGHVKVGYTAALIMPYQHSCMAEAAALAISWEIDQNHKSKLLVLCKHLLREPHAFSDVCDAPDKGSAAN